MMVILLCRYGFSPAVTGEKKEKKGTFQLFYTQNNLLLCSCLGLVRLETGPNVCFIPINHLEIFSTVNSIWQADVWTYSPLWSGDKTIITLPF